MSTALITGASRGLGYATARELGARGWNLILDARNGDALKTAADLLHTDGEIIAIAGDVADPDHRAAVAARVRESGGLDLLLNNASILGASPLPRLAETPVDVLRHVLDVNTIAPLALFQQFVGQLEARGGAVVNVTSDAAVEAYPGWGGYGASKAALDHLTAVLAEEHPGLGIYAFDPGDMRTAMHQDAFPGEDVSDRPTAASVVPALLHLLERRPPSGRYRSADLLVAAGSFG